VPEQVLQGLEVGAGFVGQECGSVTHASTSTCSGHAKVTIGDWKEEYNHDRPHSSPGYRTPRAHAAICTH
jgi:hypothetical protein